MKNLQTMQFGSQQPLYQFSSGTGRCLVLVNERTDTHQPLDADGKPLGEPITNYTYDGLWLDTVAPTQQCVIDEMRAAVLAEVEAYDKSKAVNTYTVRNERDWKSRDERVAIREAAQIALQDGRQQMTYWTNSGTALLMSPNDIIALLDKLELYALDTHDCTMRHRAAIASLSDLESLIAYDYTAGYPEQVVY